MASGQLWSELHCLTTMATVLFKCVDWKTQGNAQLDAAAIVFGVDKSLDRIPKAVCEHICSYLGISYYWFSVYYPQRFPYSHYHDRVLLELASITVAVTQEGKAKIKMG